MPIEVRNPRTGEIDYSFEPPADLAEAAERLRARQPAWEAAERGPALLAWREALLANRAAIVEALVADTGRRTESEMEVDAIAGSLQRWAAQAPELLAPEERAAAIPIVRVRQGARAYPLVGVISPWNFPLLLSLIDAIPALAAGCSVVVKPSEVAPRFIEPLAATIPAGLPLAVIPGAGETGAELVDLVDAICFTGSVPTGRLVGEQAAKRFIPAFLELGGKDPAVVLASADLERASSAILWGGTANAGQSCLSIERVYVQREVYEPFVALLEKKASALRMAHPTPADGELGPIIAADQIEVIADHLRDALDKGAVARTGGALEHRDGGTYCPATVLTEVSHAMKVMTEETFGPILPVMAFDDPDEAVRLANDSRYGLSAAVFGDAREALALGARINAGGVSINDAALTALVYDGEKNSFGYSGLGGSRMGAAALRRFIRRQAFLVAAAPEQPDPWWYPSLKG